MEQGIRKEGEVEDGEAIEIDAEAENDHQAGKKECEAEDDALLEKEGEAWVDALLGAEFYVQCECGASTKGETNMFCTECKGKAFCEKCRNESQLHRNHTNKVIQVYKSSHATCFRKQDIKKLMNISLIQSFINNSHHVIYIRPRRSNGHRNGVQPVNRCVICSWELKSEADIYCSISCKVEGIKSRKGWKVRHKGRPRRAGNYGLQKIPPYTFMPNF